MSLFTICKIQFAIGHWTSEHVSGIRFVTATVTVTVIVIVIVIVMLRNGLRIDNKTHRSWYSTAIGATSTLWTFAWKIITMIIALVTFRTWIVCTKVNLYIQQMKEHQQKRTFQVKIVYLTELFSLEDYLQRSI